MEKPKLLMQVRDAARLRHLSRRTEDAYLNFSGSLVVLPVSTLFLFSRSLNLLCIRQQFAFEESFDYFEKYLRLFSCSTRIYYRSAGLIGMLRDLRAAIGIHVAVFGSVLGDDAAEQHRFIGSARFLQQFRLHLIPTQLAAQDLIRTFHQIVSRISTDALLYTH